MSTYEIFDLLYNDFRKKIQDKNCVFTHKNTVRSQRIRIHLLKDKKNADSLKCLEFLNELQEKFAHNIDWSPFYFQCHPSSFNIVFYEFLSQNKEEMKMLYQFCRLAIA